MIGSLQADPARGRLISCRQYDDRGEPLGVQLGDTGKRHSVLFCVGVEVIQVAEGWKIRVDGTGLDETYDTSTMWREIDTAKQTRSPTWAQSKIDMVFDRIESDLASYRVPR